ncbi:MAG: preprotein translocase subunit SecG [Candidatus Omnitrophota bacterium]
MGLVTVIHIIVCALLIVLILIQSGRGGGLVENFSGIESMLGTKTNAFLTKTTTVLSVLFFTTCLTLAFLSIRQSRSLMRDVLAEKPVLSGNVTAPMAVTLATNSTK